MTRDELIDEFQRDADRHREAADRALVSLINDAERLRQQLHEENLAVSVGGGFLNRQHYDDAERNLVSWRLSAGHAFWAARS